jgi:hydrogenase maturation protein HypF
VILKLLKSKVNCVETSSIGRLFDAVSSIIGICNVVTYEGQASIELEASINHGVSHSYPYQIDLINTVYIINPNKIILSILKDKLDEVPPDIISTKFHNTVVSFTLDVCSRLREQTGINTAALSGGVFQNTYILEKLITTLEKNNFTVYSQSNFPTNDGGISLGQIAIANELIKSNYLV